MSVQRRGVSVGEMGKAPIELDWNDLLPAGKDAPLPELEAASAGGGGTEAAEGEAAMMRKFSDHDLQEKVQRLLKLIMEGVGNRLPDKGKKLRENLRHHQSELDRRKLARRPEKDFAECERVEQSGSPELAVSRNVCSPNHTKSEPCPQASPPSIFSQKIDGKDFRFMNEDECKRSVEDKEQMCEGRHITVPSSQPAKMSSRQFPCRCIIDSKISSKGDMWVAESPSISSPGNNSSICSPRKRTASEVHLLHSRSKKVQHVVLLDEEEVQPTQMIHSDSANKWKEAKIYYPSRDDPESTEIFYSDIKCLEPEQYLTSPIMNFYIRYLQRSTSLEGKASGGYYFFNTYFYKKLEEAVHCEGDRSACFPKLRRWWKGVSIFQKAYIFLPIHDEMHWSLVIICIPAKEKEAGPVLLHMDSLKLHNTDLILDLVGCFLKEEWSYINQYDPLKEIPFRERVWKSLPCRIERGTIRVPQQNNEYDCGLFVLYYMERFIQGAPERLQKNDFSMFGKGWFKPKDASGLRKWIRDLLLQEFENIKFDNGRVESATSSSGSPESDVNQGGDS